MNFGGGSLLPSSSRYSIPRRTRCTAALPAAVQGSWSPNHQPPLPMRRHLRPLLVVLSPAVVGAILRSLQIMTANREFTASAGMVAPSEVAHALAMADELFAMGLIVSLAAALVWLGSAFKRSRPELLACMLVLIGLVIAIGGTRQLSSINREIADPEGQALDPEVYQATYRTAGPVISSTQFAAAAPQLEDQLYGGSSLRLLGVALALAAAAFKAGGSARWEAARTKAAS